MEKFAHSEEIYEGNAGAGMVVVKIDRNMRIVDVKVDKDVFKTHYPQVLDDLDFMADLFKAAVNQAIDNAAKSILSRSMDSIMGKLPKDPGGWV